MNCQCWKGEQIHGGHKKSDKSSLSKGQSWLIVKYLTAIPLGSYPGHLTISFNMEHSCTGHAISWFTFLELKVASLLQISWSSTHPKELSNFNEHAVYTFADYRILCMKPRIHKIQHLGTPAFAYLRRLRAWSCVFVCLISYRPIFCAPHSRHRRSAGILCGLCRYRSKIRSLADAKLPKEDPEHHNLPFLFNCRPSANPIMANCAGIRFHVSLRCSMLLFWLLEGSPLPDCATSGKQDLTGVALGIQELIMKVADSVI